MNFQMIDAPTSEMAIGRKTRILAAFSNRVRSTRTAYTRPISVATIGTVITQIAVLRSTTWNWASVKAVT